MMMIIIIDGDDNVKLGDFGIIKIMRSYMMYGQTQIGTPLYMCPEIYKRERYDTKVDIWSLGVIIYTLTCGKPPFETPDVKSTYKKIKMCSYNFPDHVP